MKQILLFLPLILLANPSFAHPGHDHEHWLSLPIHVLTILAILGVGAALWRTVSRKNAATKTRSTRQESSTNKKG